MPKSFDTREEWLHFVTDQLRPVFDSHGATIPAKVRLSVGFTSTGERGKRIGECWTPRASGDSHSEIFIKPDQDEPVRVAGILAHELIHAAVGIEAGHKAPFKRVALAIGLTGKMTATTEGPAFVSMISPILVKAGPLPHKRLNAMKTLRKKQATRLLKAECADCGYTVRITQKWLAKGAPLCGVCHEPMVCEDFDGGGDE